MGAHLRAAATWFGDALDDDQLAALDDALQTLADHMRRLDGDGPGDGRPEEQEHEE